MIRRRMFVLVAAVAGLLVTGTAFADSIRIVRGGPGGSIAKADFLASLDDLAPMLQICFLNPTVRHATVKVQVTGSGAVKRSGAGDRTAASQCVAGIIAVQTLSVRAPFKATVHVPAVRMKVPRGKADLVRRRLRKCYDRAVAQGRASSGEVTLRFFVRKDGIVTNAQVVRSNMRGMHLSDCLVDTLSQMRVEGMVSSGRGAWFTLPMKFRSPQKAPKGKPTPPELRPDKRGPLSGSAIQVPIGKATARWKRCYDRVAAKNPKLRGIVTMELLIPGKGGVASVKVFKDTMRSKPVRECLKKNFRTIRFPKARSGQPTIVRYPIQFAPKK